MNKRSDTQAGKVKLYGKLHHLSKPVEWTQGLSNMFERLVWEPKLLLGVSKAEYVRQIVDMCLKEIDDKYQSDNQINQDTIIKRLGKKITKRLEKEAYKYTKWERCEQNVEGEKIIAGNEALRRARFHSEEYLNVEFDVFLSLAPDSYLDQLYSRHFSFDPGNKWTTRGDAGQFGNGSDTGDMHMDNLAYNQDSKMFIGNELKLDADKGDGQILKYIYLFLRLKEQPFEGEGPFINEEDEFHLLFFSPTNILADVDEEVKNEFRFYDKKISRNKAKRIRP